MNTIPYLLNGKYNLNIPADLAEAISSIKYHFGPRYNHLEYSSLESFAQDFNPVAAELFAGEYIKAGDPAWDEFQQLCIQMFEYGDAMWPGMVFEDGVKDHD